MIIIKRRVSILLTAVLLAGCLFCCPPRASAEETAALTEGQMNIVKRAYQMTEIEWTPQADITGWRGNVTYKAGKSYKGLPYGQPVHAAYVPWKTDLNGFIEAVNDAESLMYTEKSTYNQVAPYYSVDCSAFVSWAWQLPARKTTRTIPDYAELISESSYLEAEVGDCFDKPSSHVVLVTDIRKNESGEIISVEIAESTTNLKNDYCCQRTVYGEGGSYTLDYMQSKYFGNGYALYRSKTRDEVTYEHSCASQLEGDVCEKCGYGTEPDVEPDYTVGDTDGDGNISVNDARTVLRVAIKLEECEAGTVLFKCCDANGNNEVTVEDARIVLRWAIGLE